MKPEASARRRKWVYIPPGTILGLGIVGAILYYNFYTNAVRQFYAYAGYGNALISYYAQYEKLPESLAELEEAYNAVNTRNAWVPPSPPYERPLYRPVHEVKNGRYLVIVAPKAREWLGFITVVIYANQDGSKTELKLVKNWEIDDLVRQDDALRAQNTLDKK